MADEEIAEAVARLQAGEEVEDGALDRTVERGGRLVENDKAGPEDQRPRDGDALARPRKRRPACETGARVDTDLLQRACAARSSRSLALSPARRPKPFGDDRRDAQSRRERCERVLEVICIRRRSGRSARSSIA